MCPRQDGTDLIPNGGAINIDSVATFGFTVPFTDYSTASSSLQRHILFANNSYGFENWYTDFIANNAINDTAQAVNKEYVMPMMSGKTYQILLRARFDRDNRFQVHQHGSTLPGECGG